MGKVLGIIAEYNPFHNGHLYHLRKSQEIAKAKYTVAVIGGNFTQRGDCSLISKWAKTDMALSNGIDLVIELPTLYSISSAENFAEGAIKILNSLKVVDSIAFGSEVNDISTLNMMANVLYEEPKEYKAILSHELGKGLSFPKARENALLMYLNDIRRFSNILSSPNNILAIEYLKALKKYKSNIKPISIQRKNSGYLDLEYNGNIASSTAIRNLLKTGKISDIKPLLTPHSYNILMECIHNGHAITDISCLEKIIIYNLRRMSISEIANLQDVSEGLEYSIKKAADSCNSIQEFINIVSSKRYTNTRIQRILLYSLLGITKKDIEISRKVNPYIRVLGFNDKGQYILSEAKRANPKLEIVSSVKKFVDSNNNKNLKLMLDKDIYASNVYTLGFSLDSWSNLDYTQKIIKI